jgi:murein DD-endopeptidase MepM/ murein hydrolase activator NlpD
MEEPMKETNDRMERFRLFLRNNGFYIALAVCLIVIGAAILLLALDKPEEESEAQAPADDAPIVIVGKSEDERLGSILHAPTAAVLQKPSTPVPTAVPTAIPLPTLTPEPTKKPASAPSKAAPPVSGEIVFGFAVDKLLYSVTLDQWTTHAAVDIRADAGTQVKCVFAGTVERVEKDDALGYTVTVSHANGRTTLYANLGEDVRVKVGDRLNAGDVIGTVGTSAISECALPPHLHFAITVDGVAKDPAKYVRLG